MAYMEKWGQNRQTVNQWRLTLFQIIVKYDD